MNRGDKMVDILNLIKTTFVHSVFIYSLNKPPILYFTSFDFYDNYFNQYIVTPTSIIIKTKKSHYNYPITIEQYSKIISTVKQYMSKKTSITVNYLRYEVYCIYGKSYAPCTENKCLKCLFKVLKPNK